MWRGQYDVGASDQYQVAAAILGRLSVLNDGQRLPSYALCVFDFVAEQVPVEAVRFLVPSAIITMVPSRTYVSGGTRSTRTASAITTPSAAFVRRTTSRLPVISYGPPKSPHAMPSRSLQWIGRFIKFRGADQIARSQRSDVGEG